MKEVILIKDGEIALKGLNRRTFEDVLKKNIKMLVIACNTATAVALEEIRQRVSIPVVGVILPGSRAAIKYSRNNRIGVIGTVGTINSNLYEMTMKNKHPDIYTYSISCPKFVALVESWLN